MFKTRQGFNWSLLLIGLLFILSGLFVLSHPKATLALIATLLGILAIIKGIYELWFKQWLEKWTGQKLGKVFILGIVDIILGLLFVFRPLAGINFIVYVFAFWFILDAVLQLSFARILKTFSESYYKMIMVSNLLILLLGVILLFNPLEAGVLVVWVIALFLIITGILQLLAAFAK